MTASSSGSSPPPSDSSASGAPASGASAPGSARSPELVIRFATPADVATVLRFIRALARYTQQEDEVVADEAALRTALFGPRPSAEVLLAELAGAPIGFALFFANFSTFLGRPGLYLEDLFVEPAARGHGAGLALMTALAQIAVDRDYGRFEWAVLDWNQPALEFYAALGAVPKTEYTIHRLTGAPLAALAALAQGRPGRATEP